MQAGIEIIFSIIGGAIIAAIGSLVTSRLALLRRRKYDKLRQELMQIYEEKYAKQLNKYSNLYYKEDIGHLWEALAEESANASSSASLAFPTVSIEDRKKDVERRFESLKERIEGIEKRFPEQNTVDKIASVNEAILATQIENLTDSIRKMDEKLLTRWDVAKIVFQIIAALSGLVALVFVIINHFKNNASP